MPFFLSHKRNTGAPQGTQQLSSDFVRAAPSAEGEIPSAPKKKKKFNPFEV
jgi:hypothetical protein